MDFRILEIQGIGLKGVYGSLTEAISLSMVECFTPGIIFEGVFSFKMPNPIVGKL